MLGFILSKTSLRVAIIAIASLILYYAYDNLCVAPKRALTAKYEAKIRNQNKIINNAGVLIGTLNQKVYDLDYELRHTIISNDINVSNCIDDLTKLKGDLEDEKIDNNATDFYLNYSF